MSIAARSGLEDKARWTLEAAGAALLLMMPYFFPILVPYSTALYHHDLPLTHVGGAVLLDLLGAFLLAGVLLWSVSRLPSRARSIVAALLAGCALARAGWFVLQLTDIWHSQLQEQGLATPPRIYTIIVSNWDQWGSWLAAALLVVLLPLLAVWRPDLSRPIVNATRLGFAALAFSGLWIIPKLVYISFFDRPLQSQMAMQQARNSHKRIIWILFDELSYDLVFEHKSTGMEFPNFDKLRAKSVSFDNLEPAGFYTERIIPSLLLGQPIDKIRSDSDGRLWRKLRKQDQWTEYDPGKSLFALAQYNGWNPGVAGWFNPYCRIFTSYLAWCHSLPSVNGALPIEDMGASEQRSILANARIVPHMLVRKLLLHQDSSWGWRLEETIADYRNIMQDASKLIRNDQIHFVFIHLPVPHPPGFYDRHTHQLCTCGNYLDNLVLADDSLGMLLRQIDQTPSASQTTLIVSSDHSLRIPIWKSLHIWSDEEERVTQGRFDARPVFLVRFPAQNSEQSILAPVPELTEHDILSAMLELRISDPKDLDTLLQPSVQQPGQLSLAPAPPPLQ